MGEVVNGLPSDERSADAFDLGEYCRRVEEHLARVNQGHLIRIVGPAFELVRGWALSGVPLGIVFRGIDQKAERHRAGRSKRPLRLEFCEADVRAINDDWRRAVGISAIGAETGESTVQVAAEERRRPSMTKQLDRAIEKLVRASSRLETEEPVRNALVAILENVAAIREECRAVRGAARTPLVDRLILLDREIADVAKLAAGARLAGIRSDAEADLSAFRGRLSPEAWQRSVDASLDRMLRDQQGLPTLDVDIASS